MREQYIKQVKRKFGLYLPRKKRNEIIRDLNEIFCSAREHNETEKQVIDRLGTPDDFVKNTLEQMDTDRPARRIGRELMTGIAALLIAAVSLSFFVTARLDQVPDVVIGAADAMTSIQVAGGMGLDGTWLLLAVGLAALGVAAVQIIRAIWNGRRPL